MNFAPILLILLTTLKIHAQSEDTKEKVVFINEEVIKIKTFNKKWIISLSNKTNFVCEELHSTSAINFKINNNMIFNKNFKIKI